MLSVRKLTKKALGSQRQASTLSASPPPPRGLKSDSLASEGSGNLMLLAFSRFDTLLDPSLLFFGHHDIFNKGRGLSFFCRGGQITSMAW
jgi:hypothetical protein